MSRGRRRLLGQHFLVKPDILDKIVEYGRVTREDTVLEVGAGRGELTWRIAERAGRVIAVEIDRGLVRELERRVSSYSNVEILVGDVLELRPTGFNKVISNPPYSISRRLMEWLMESGPELMVMTLQREFAVKLIANPGSPKYVYLSFLSGLLYESKIVEIVPRSYFNPPPRVDSAIVLMRRRPSVNKPGDEVRSIIRAIFTQRKQTLRRALGSVLRDEVIREQVAQKVPESLLSRRVFQLSPSELLEVAELISSIGEKPK